MRAMRSVLADPSPFDGVQRSRHAARDNADRIGSESFDHVSPDRRGSPPTAGERFAILKLETSIPTAVWYSGFTVRHPETLIEIHNVTSLERGLLLADLEIYGSKSDLTREIGSYPDVVNVVRVNALGDVGAYQVAFRNWYAIKLASELNMIIRYPRTVQRGVLTIETIGRTIQIRAYIAGLRAFGLKTRVVALRRDSMRSSQLILTNAQRAAFRQAFALGYFEVPRWITLTALARRMSRNPSTVSRTLAVVESKLAQAASAAMT